jgi:hypothetical protein
MVPGRVGIVHYWPVHPRLNSITIYKEFMTHDQEELKYNLNHQWPPSFKSII